MSVTNEIGCLADMESIVWDHQITYFSIFQKISIGLSVDFIFSYGLIAMIFVKQKFENLYILDGNKAAGA